MKNEKLADKAIRYVNFDPTAHAEAYQRLEKDLSKSQGFLTAGGGLAGGLWGLSGGAASLAGPRAGRRMLMSGGAGALIGAGLGAFVGKKVKDNVRESLLSGKARVRENPTAEDIDRAAGGMILNKGDNAKRVQNIDAMNAAGALRPTGVGTSYLRGKRASSQFYRMPAETQNNIRGEIAAGREVNRKRKRNFSTASGAGFGALIGAGVGSFRRMNGNPLASIVLPSVAGAVAGAGLGAYTGSRPHTPNKRDAEHFMEENPYVLAENQAAANRATLSDYVRSIHQL